MKPFLNIGVSLTKLLFLLSTTLFLLHTARHAAQAQTTDPRALQLEQELSEMAADGVQGFLYWQYSGVPGDQGFGHDVYSFYEGDPICEVLNNNAYLFDFIGVNISSLGTVEDGARQRALDYLSSQCGVTVIRIFGSPDRGGVGATLNVLNQAAAKGIQIIVTLCDFSNTCSDLGIDGAVRSNPTNWYQNGYTQPGGGPNYSGSYLEYAIEMANAIRNNPGLYGIELLNEPHCSGNTSCIIPYINWANTIASAIGGNVGIGQMASQDTTRGDSPRVSEPGEQPDFYRSNNSPAITMASAHYYNADEKDSARTARFQAQQLGKYFYIGEYGYMSQNPPPIPGPGDTYIPCNQTILDEPHPLRPYPGTPCGPIEAADTPYCAMRPWAVTTWKYLKNRQDCQLGDPVYPCTARDISGNYSIDLQEFELPLVSTTKQQYSNLTFFNRAQEHHADYFEGRAYYEGLVEPDLNNSPIDFAQVWKRLGIFRKILPLSMQNELRIQNINSAGINIHDYIVGYYINDDIVNWGTSNNRIRMSDFIGYFPPTHDCYNLIDPLEKEQCLTDYYQELEDWQATIYGKLWPYVPMVTREDSIGYVTIIAEPGQPFGQLASPIYMPHLNRLNAITDQLQTFMEPITNRNTQLGNENYTPVDGLTQTPPDCEIIGTEGIDYLFTPQSLIDLSRKKRG